MAEYSETTPTYTAESSHETAVDAHVDTHLELSELHQAEGLPDEPMAELPPLEDGFDWDLRRLNNDYGEPVTHEGSDESEPNQQFDQEGHNEDSITNEASFFIPGQHLPVPLVRIANPRIAEIQSRLTTEDLPATEETTVLEAEIVSTDEAATQAIDHYQQFTHDQETVQHELETGYVDRLARLTPEQVLEGELIEEKQIPSAEAHQGKSGEVIDAEFTVEQLIPDSWFTPPPEIKTEFQTHLKDELTAADFEALFKQREVPIPEWHERLVTTEIDSVVESDLAPEQQFRHHLTELWRLIMFYYHLEAAVTNQETAETRFRYDGDFVTREDIHKAIEDQYAITLVAFLFWQHENDLPAFAEAVEATFDTHYERLLVTLPEEENGPVNLKIVHEIGPEQERSLVITFPANQQLGGTHGNTTGQSTLSQTALSGRTTKETRLTVRPA